MVRKRRTQRKTKRRRKTRHKKRKRKHRTRRRRLKRGGDLFPDGEGGQDHLYVSGMPDELVDGNNYHSFQLCPPGGTIGTKGNFRGGKDNWRVAFCNKAKDKGVCCPPNFTCNYAYPDGKTRTMECRAPPDSRPPRIRARFPRTRDASELRAQRNTNRRRAERDRRRKITKADLYRRSKKKEKMGHIHAMGWNPRR